MASTRRGLLGKKWGLCVIVLDVIKGALAGCLGLLLGDAGAYAAGTGVIVGHCWPVWTGFRGGKGVASAGGSFFAVFPPMVPLNGVFTGTVALLTKNSRLAMRARWCSGCRRGGCGGPPTSRCGGAPSPGPVS